MSGPAASSDAARRRMRANRRRDTAPELALRSELHRRGHRFRVDHPIRAGGRPLRPDLVFTAARVAVFVDGCFWHGCPRHGTTPRANAGYWEAKLRENGERDRSTNAKLRAAGWKVVRIWAHVPVMEAANRVEARLARAR